MAVKTKVTDFEEMGKEMCKEEWKSYVIYSYLAATEKNEKVAKKLKTIAEQERRHFEFWRRHVECEPPKVNLRKIKIMRKIFGTHFLLKLMERSETDAIKCYKRLLEEAKDEETKRELEEILKDEMYHENELIKDVEDIRVKYLGYIALGLADAVVEVTGVHAGFLGATANTILAGLAGIIVGFSASLSMSGAAYLQAKHDPSVSPPVSAGITGLAYILSVVLLALPYFIIHNIWGAFVASLMVAMAILGAFIYYSSVIQDKNFMREYVESVTLLMLTAFGSFAFGKVMEMIIGTSIFGH
ncbi:hypothetical protein IPA_06980 [Ignicoccus pacificus DSM 13166]|uniref:Rubrerythrin diiron-binding domain-containing protein n=1 Tax=Ignicoccus pacificus DSM 13166 TaxID=940294 RepID=A0A977K9U9_9CREN|nr:hypothetical protein IPA_06980 [Ignicoccus pacificus DSM 13166]